MGFNRELKLIHAYKTCYVKQFLTLSQPLVNPFRFQPNKTTIEDKAIVRFGIFFDLPMGMHGLIVYPNVGHNNYGSMETNYYPIVKIEDQS